jgi:hypothetical protein
MFFSNITHFFANIYLEIQVSTQLKKNVTSRKCMNFPFYSISNIYSFERAQDDPAGVAAGYELGGREIVFRFPAGERDISILHRVPTGFEAHPAYYPTSTKGSFPGGKAGVL